jgi:hypothetical protein
MGVKNLYQEDSRISSLDDIKNLVGTILILSDSSSIDEAFYEKGENNINLVAAGLTPPGKDYIDTIDSVRDYVADVLDGKTTKLDLNAGEFLANYRNQLELYNNFCSD